MRSLGHCSKPISHVHFVSPVLCPCSCAEAFQGSLGVDIVQTSHDVKARPDANAQFLAALRQRLPAVNVVRESTAGLAKSEHHWTCATFRGKVPTVGHSFHRCLLAPPAMLEKFETLVSRCRDRLEPYLLNCGWCADNSNDHDMIGLPENKVMPVRQANLRDACAEPLHNHSMFLSRMCRSCEGYSRV